MDMAVGVGLRMGQNIYSRHWIATEGCSIYGIVNARFPAKMLIGIYKLTIK
jgi:hypothetical protein